MTPALDRPRADLDRERAAGAAFVLETRQPEPVAAVGRTAEGGSGTSPP